MWTAGVVFIALAGCAGDPDGLAGDGAADDVDGAEVVDVAGDEGDAGDASVDRGDARDASDGDASDGDASDGDASDGDASDGDASDGDAGDGDVRDVAMTLPDLPAMPDAPVAPDAPAAMDVPALPDAPTTPDAPARMDVREVGVDATSDAREVGVDAALDVREVGVDATVDVREAGVDAALDVREAGVDVVLDVREAGVDATVDVREAGVDAVADVREAGVDVVLDVREAGVDAVADVREAGVDAAMDVVADVREAAVDVSVDVSVPPDPVTYVGSFPIRTSGAAFLTTLTVLGSRREVWVLLPRVLPAHAPLVLGFHGTNSDGATMLSESGASAVSDAQGVVFIAPTSRWFSETGADFDHPGGNGTYWETANNPNPNTNEDLVLTRAIIQEARRAFGVDPTRVYAYGHSNGGFMAYMVSQVLRERVVGFGANSAGLSRCNPQQSCRFQGRGTTCAALAMQSGWCNCTGPELPVPVGATGRRTPGILLHGTADPLVSVYHTCTLDSLMRARGNPVQLTLFDGGGHSSFPSLASRVWTYLSAYRLAP
jgi:poly(3-hydroxybutyrate) depolymerase